MSSGSKTGQHRAYAQRRLIQIFACMLPWAAAAQPAAGAGAPAAGAPASGQPAAAEARGAANAIESVTSASQGTTTVVRIALAKPLAALPVSFSVATPPRIAIDLPDTENRVGQSAVELGQGDVRTANIVQAGARSRLVLNLKRAATYTASLDGNALLLTLDAVSNAQAAAGAAAAPASSAPYSFARGEPSAAGHALRDVDFRRGREGEGRVIVELSDARTGVDIRQQGQQIIVDFLRTRLPENLRRQLDVGDFGTPVRSVRVTQHGENTRMVIEPSGAWEHNAYQSDTQFVVEVKPLREDPNKLAQGARG